MASFAWGLFILVVATCYGQSYGAEFLLFGTEYDDMELNVDSDGKVLLQQPIIYYDQDYTSVFVNQRGFVSFDGPVRDMQIVPKLVDFKETLIAAFYADISSIDGFGTVYYR